MLPEPLNCYQADILDICHASYLSLRLRLGAYGGGGTCTGLNSVTGGSGGGLGSWIVWWTDKNTKYYWRVGLDRWSGWD